jgi:hypothetical protein
MSRAHRGVARPDVAGERARDWKGDAVGYKALHKWVGRQMGRAREHLCISCLSPACDWANVSGTYRRSLDDFVPLCKSCHGWFDFGKERR